MASGENRSSYRVIPTRMIKLTRDIAVDPTMIGRYSRANGRLYVYSKGDSLIGVIDEIDENVDAIIARLDELFALA